MLSLRTEGGRGMLNRENLSPEWNSIRGRLQGIEMDEEDRRLFWETMEAEADRVLNRRSLSALSRRTFLQAVSDAFDPAQVQHRTNYHEVSLARSDEEAWVTYRAWVFLVALLSLLVALLLFLADPHALFAFLLAGPAFLLAKATFEGGRKKPGPLLDFAGLLVRALSRHSLEDFRSQAFEINPSVQRWLGTTSVTLMVLLLLVLVTDTAASILGIVLGLLPPLLGVGLWSLSESLRPHLAAAARGVGARLFPFEGGLEYVRHGWAGRLQGDIEVLFTQVYNQTTGSEVRELLLDNRALSNLHRNHVVEDLVETRATRRLRNVLASTPSGCVALSGRRGAGKTTALQRLQEDPSRRLGASLILRLSASSKYDAKEFVLAALRQLCASTLRREGVDSGRGDHRPARIARMGSLLLSALTVIARLVATAAGAALLVACVWLVTEAVRDRRFTDQQLISTLTGWLPQLRDTLLTAWKVSSDNDRAWFTASRWALAAVCLLVGVRLIHMRPRRRRWTRDGFQQDILDVYDQTTFAASFVESSTLGFTLQSAGAMNATRSINRTRQQLTLPDVIDEFARVARLVGAKYSAHRQAPGLIVCLDDLDRVGSTKDAEDFLGAIKGLFRTESTVFVIAMTDGLMQDFRARAVVGTDLRDGAIDEVVEVHGLRLEESRDILQQRVLGFQEDFVRLAHCLSAGSPRELIRAARVMAQTSESCRAEGIAPTAAELCKRVVVEDTLAAIGLYIDRLEELRRSGSGGETCSEMLTLLSRTAAALSRSGNISAPQVLRELRGIHVALAALDASAIADARIESLTALVRTNATMIKLFHAGARPIGQRRDIGLVAERLALARALVPRRPSWALAELATI